MKNKGIEEYSLCQCLTMMSLTDFDGGKISCWRWLICLWKFVSLTDSVTLDFGKLKQASRPSLSCCFVAHRTTWCEKKTLFNLEQGEKNIARNAYVRCQDMEFETWNVNHIMWSIPIYQGIWWSRILFPRPLLFKILIWGFQGHNLFARVIWSLCWRSSSKHPLFTTLSPPQWGTYTHLNTHSVGHTPTLSPPQCRTYTHPNTLWHPTGSHIAEHACQRHHLCVDSFIHLIILQCIKTDPAKLVIKALL